MLRRARVAKLTRTMLWVILSKCVVFYHIMQAKPVAKKLALACRVSVSYFASSAFLAECLVSYLSVKALRAEGPVSYLSIAALRAQRNRSSTKKIWTLRAHVLMQPNEFDACARSCMPWRTFVTEVGRGHVLR
jgi:hypothetical protein